MRSALARRSFIVSAALLALAPSNANAAARTPAANSLDGAWEGTLSDISGEGLATTPNPFPAIRLVINGAEAQVFMHEGDGWTEAKPGTFHIARNLTNALVYSLQIDDSQPPGQSWVETWSLAVTLRGPNTLAVTFTRVVNNNNNMAPEEDGAAFMMVRTGALHRTYPDHV